VNLKAETRSSAVLKVEKDLSNRRFTLSSSAVLATGTLFGSAFVPMMATAGPAPLCRFSEEMQGELLVEMARTDIEACEAIELYNSAPDDGSEFMDLGFGNWVVDQQLVVPFGKDLRIFSNDGVILVNDFYGTVDDNYGINLDGLLSPSSSVIRHGGYEDGYLYQNLGTLEIDGIGFFSYGPQISAITSNQNLVISNSAMFGNFLYGIAGHNIEITNSTIAPQAILEFNQVIAGVYSLPGLSQDADRSELIPGSVELTYNTFVMTGLFSDVFGVGMEISTEGNIFNSQDGFFSEEDISSTTQRSLPFHVVNFDSELFFDLLLEGEGAFGLGDVFEDFWGPEFSIEPPNGEDGFAVSSNTYRSEITTTTLRQEWFEDSFNLFELEPGALVTAIADGSEDSAEIITTTVGSRSQTGVSFDDLAFEDVSEQTFAPNTIPTIGLTSSSIAARFVTEPLYPQTIDARGQARTLPYSAGAVEFDGLLQTDSGSTFGTDSGSTFGFSPELFVVSPARLPSKSGQKITVTGPSLPEVKEVFVGGKKVKVVSSSVNKLVVTAPKGMRGAQEILIKTNSGELLLKDRIFFTNSLSIRGFGDSKSVLSKSMKRQIQKFLKENPHATLFTCQGFSSLPLNLKDQAFGSQRGKAVCDYVVSIRSDVKVKILSPVVDKRSGPSIRRTVLKVID
jgi:hypothetical protein